MKRVLIGYDIGGTSARVALFEIEATTTTASPPAHSPTSTGLFLMKTEKSQHTGSQNILNRIHI